MHGYTIHESDINGSFHGFCGQTTNGLGGALVERKAAPSKDGPLVYFDGGADLNDYLNKVEGLGGKITC